MNADVHARPSPGRTNSPSTVNNNPRALADPAACRRDIVGALADTTQLWPTTNLLRNLDV
jgi:hypothetical protein